MRWPRTGESGNTSASSASSMTVQIPSVAYWLQPTLDFHIPAHVDASSTAKVISRDTADFVMVHNTRATDSVAKAHIRMSVRRTFRRPGDLTRHSRFCDGSQHQSHRQCLHLRMSVRKDLQAIGRPHQTLKILYIE